MANSLIIWGVILTVFVTLPIAAFFYYVENAKKKRKF